ncbi:glycosyltransferase [Novosphingobium album (ex Hu et al. 2023)]|uniref:Glycosyltransferase n=1 Tax=Novosphingobium album (ex Hu et al. 2023) TaxID=2930093 RepID=A0ABT0AX50_9SPHN|nr:glycosyltransferase [Novosphingobium album (ex Hu et al. 2023)]MCJ2177362.1 glycosyltransferase [Novosphingobium album (ex Hu et al. 2023)]
MDRPLSIIVPIHSFEPGGVERVGLNLAQYWHSAGHNVTVVLGRDEGLDRPQAPKLRYKALRSLVPTAHFETLWMIWSLLVHLESSDPDVIFCAGNTYAIVCVVMRLILGRACPPIVAKISNDLVRRDKSLPYRMAYRLWLRIQGRIFDRIVGMAPPMREEISGLMQVPDERVAIIPDPALSRSRLERLLAIPRSGMRSANLRFVAVGRLVSQKNFALLLRAFARGFHPGDTLTIVGDGPERSGLQALASKLSLQRHVTFTGHLPSPDAQLEHADCLLLSSNYEGVPAVVIEAIAAGLPVIATDCSMSMPELLNGGRGVLVPSGDDNALAAGISGAAALSEITPSHRQYAASFVLEDACEHYLRVMYAAITEAATDRQPPLIPPRKDLRVPPGPTQ